MEQLGVYFLPTFKNFSNLTDTLHRHFSLERRRIRQHAKDIVLPGPVEMQVGNDSKQKWHGVDLPTSFHFQSFLKTFESFLQQVHQMDEYIRPLLALDPSQSGHIHRAYEVRDMHGNMHRAYTTLTIDRFKT
jgi:hypothetical protein